MALDGVVESISNIAIGEAQKQIEQTPLGQIVPPQTSGSYFVDQNVVDGMSEIFMFSISQPSIDLWLAFPIPGAKVIEALNYGESLWGKTAKIIVELPSGETDNYFLKVAFSLN